MTIDELLALDNATLAELYSNWGESNYCAGWLVDDFVPQFVEAMLNPEYNTSPSWQLDKNQIITLEKIRQNCIERKRQ